MLNVGKKIKTRRNGRANAATLRLEKLQQKLWKANLAIAIIVFFVLSVWWIGIDLKYFEKPPQSTDDLMQLADLAAIGVFGIELYSRYRKTPDKVQFLKKNWLEIIVLLPMGLLFRFYRGLEAAGSLRPVSSALRIGDKGLLAPEVAWLGRAAAKLFAEAQEWVAHFSVISDFFAMVAENAGKLLRLR
jgi:hypothetical protein